MLSFQRRFVPADKKAFDLISWNHRPSRIVDAHGREIFSHPRVEAPAAWSDLAVDIVASRYFRQKHESSVKQMVDRAVAAIVQAGAEYFDSPASAENFAEDLRYILITQRAAFNSPVWFNLGLYAAYGERAGGGNFRYFPERGATIEIANNYEWPQVSACFILKIADDLMGIFELLKTEAKLFKYGSGTGTNFSTLRGRQENLQGGGLSSGLISFLEVFDRAAGATKSGGTTRRAAKMVCLDADHPEILDFIRWKKLEEQKAQALIQAGYSSDMDGPAYRTVSGQNSNNSVRLSDDFFVQLQTNGTLTTTARTTGHALDSLAAREVWQELCAAAWFCADPGIHLTSTIERRNPCKNSGAIRASNPCAEYMFLDDSACNLASINLVAFLQEQDGGSLAIDDFEHTARLLFVAQDILVGHASYPTAAVAQNSFDFRPLGLGYANLGGYLMRQGVAYDSAAAAAITEGITALLHACAAKASAEMAQALGSFVHFEKNRDCFFEVMALHTADYEQLPGGPVAARAKTRWQQAMQKGQAHGFRNAQWTVLAPTGTIGLMMDCDTTGIEPEFSLFKTKKLAGGGQLQIVNQSVAHGLRALGYDATQVTKALTALQQKRTLVGAIADVHLPAFDCAAEDAAGRSLEPRAHLTVVAAAQKFLSGSVSKTINLRQDIAPAAIGELYLQAHKMGIKAMSVYRAGSKWSEPLTADGRPPTGPKCSECGHVTISTGGCYRCLNCGHAESC